MPDAELSARIATIYEHHAAFLEPRLQSLGIGWGTFQLLSAVYAAGGAVSQAEIARRLGVTPATLSETAYAHVQRGLLTQSAAGSDRRVKALALTKRAEDLMRKVATCLAEAEEAISEGLTTSEKAALSKSLDKIIANLERRSIAESPRTVTKAR